MNFLSSVIIAVIAALAFMAIADAVIAFFSWLFKNDRDERIKALEKEVTVLRAEIEVLKTVLSRRQPPPPLS